MKIGYLDFLITLATQNWYKQILARVTTQI